MQTLDPVIICKHLRTDVPHLNYVFSWPFVSISGRALEDELRPVLLWDALYQQWAVESYDTRFKAEMTSDTMSLS